MCTHSCMSLHIGVAGSSLACLRVGWLAPEGPVHCPLLVSSPYGRPSLPAPCHLGRSLKKSPIFSCYETEYPAQPAELGWGRDSIPSSFRCRELLQGSGQRWHLLLKLNKTLLGTVPSHCLSLSG